MSISQLSDGLNNFIRYMVCCFIVFTIYMYYIGVGLLFFQLYTNVKIISSSATTNAVFRTSGNATTTTTAATILTNRLPVVTTLIIHVDMVCNAASYRNNTHNTCRHGMYCCRMLQQQFTTIIIRGM